MNDKCISVSGFCCHICAKDTLDIVPGYEEFCRVTSDCKPWNKGGKLGICQTCGCTQKIVDNAWRAEVNEIYESYSIYHQSGGMEQAVFDGVSGRPSPRSFHLLNYLNRYQYLPEAGRLLDVGCGNGALLRSFSSILPSWSLVGTDANHNYRTIIEEIDGVESFYTCNPDQIDGTFDLISMIHVLEHIPAPIDFLIMLRDKLASDGLLIIEVFDYLQNPYDLLIADHCTHFIPATIAGLLQNAGFDVISIAVDCIPKELTVIARRSEYPQNSTVVAGFPSFDITMNSLLWLRNVVKAAYNASGPAFGLFGTAIAATWLFSELENIVSFFVDEDPYRAGKTYMGYPVYHPLEVPDNNNVFIGLIPAMAEKVQNRIKQLNPRLNYFIPPRFPWDTDFSGSWTL